MKCMRCLKMFLRKSSSIKGRLFSLHAGLAQLVRAHGLHPWGQRFESVIPHHKTYTANYTIYVLLVQVQLSRLLGYRTIGSSIEKMCLVYIGDWCNGNTVAFEAVVRGSSPLSPANRKRVSSRPKNKPLTLRPVIRAKARV